MTTPTKSTMAACREAKCGKVPQWLRRPGPYVSYEEVETKYAGKRDFLGFIDVLCFCPPVCIGIQATTSGHLAARLHKICNERAENAWYWLACGNAIEVWGWRKYSKPVDGRWWRARIVDVTFKDLKFAKP